MKYVQKLQKPPPPQKRTYSTQNMKLFPFSLLLVILHLLDPDPYLHSQCQSGYGSSVPPKPRMHAIPDPNPQHWFRNQDRFYDYYLSLSICQWGTRNKSRTCYTVVITKTGRYGIRLNLLNAEATTTKSLLNTMRRDWPSVWCTRDRGPPNHSLNTPCCSTWKTVRYRGQTIYFFKNFCLYAPPPPLLV